MRPGWKGQELMPRHWVLSQVWGEGVGIWYIGGWKPAHLGSILGGGDWDWVVPQLWGSQSDQACGGSGLSSLPRRAETRGHAYCHVGRDHRLSAWGPDPRVWGLQSASARHRERVSAVPTYPNCNQGFNTTQGYQSWRPCFQERHSTDNCPSQSDSKGLLSQGPGVSIRPGRQP